MKQIFGLGLFPLVIIAVVGYVGYKKFIKKEM